MGYKFKPRKSVAKRFRVTSNGKLKHERSLRRHLLSGRSADAKRRNARPDVLNDSMAANLRLAMGVSGLKPKRTIHFRQLKEQQAGQADAAA